MVKLSAKPAPTLIGYLFFNPKGKSGILATQPSRALFLTDKSHRIHFVYTPNIVLG
jgi:hypothetical protein